MARLLIWCLVWMQVHWSEKSKLWKQIGAMESNARKWLPRRDVITSRRWVNQYRSQQFKTSRRLNVAMPQRRDVATSRRQLEICTSSFKVRRAQKSGAIGRRTNEGMEFQSRVTQTSKKCPGFVLFLIFCWILE